MRFAVLVMALAVSACASASDPVADYARFRDQMYVGVDEQGSPVVSSAPANEAKDFNHFTGGEVLTPDMVRAFIAETAPDTIPVALISRRNVDWRVPRAELLAILDAAGVTDQFR